MCLHKQCTAMQLRGLARPRTRCACCVGKLEAWQGLETVHDLVFVDVNLAAGPLPEDLPKAFPELVSMTMINTTLNATVPAGTHFWSEVARAEASGTSRPTPCAACRLPS